ncbi:NAD(P)-dependent oxidoreductase [Turneriella parva]|uniref:6-phosphogluconate dehydrogenase NAD-binding protein n=1 Tax=Turneriella parva (strain ATCC BAA-1111 / DSM 21527 / NCTC 11395 / H) TaxID=869212 RepID=I4B6J4_TURPD|nr:NAD(P)-binding domain-containing protein [Turneriella parva]AFM12901.1 6-phosphogluconate dehydrogenase NAD-binding protein [Turneriella parva DSM 21527]
MITILGTGLLGSAFARASLRRGEQLGVWNRTLDRAAQLGKEGAKVFIDAGDAVRGAERIHMVLSDDVAVESVIKTILPALGKGALLVDHTTTSVAGAVARTEKLAAIGVFYQHAPVFMSPQNALDAAGVMLLSGDKNRFAALSPVLTPMTGKLAWLGPEPGRAAAMKLAGNLMLMAVTAGLADVARFLKSEDFSPADFLQLLEHFDPGASVKPRAGRMFSGSFENPSWELKMARKDARLIADASTSATEALRFLPAIAAEMDRYIEKGFGDKDWTVMGHDLADL